MQYNTLSAAVLVILVCWRRESAKLWWSAQIHRRWLHSVESSMVPALVPVVPVAAVACVGSALSGRPLRTLECCNGSWRCQEDGTLLGFSASGQSHVTMHFCYFSFSTSVALQWHFSGTSVALQWHFSGTSVALQWHFGFIWWSRWVSSRERSCGAAIQCAEQATSQPQGEHIQSNWSGNPTNRK